MLWTKSASCWEAAGLRAVSKLPELTTFPESGSMAANWGSTLVKVLPMGRNLSPESASSLEAAATKLSHGALSQMRGVRTERKPLQSGAPFVMTPTGPPIVCLLQDKTTSATGTP